jgi:hypothetical protein
MDKFLIAHIGHTHKDYEHICWWKPNSRGYTICVDKAGRYDEDEATSICRCGTSIAVPADVTETLALSTPYYRMSNGRLALLYDGGPHRPVANSAENWMLLMNKRLSVANAYPVERPTSIAKSRSRAIYLDALPEIENG